ncbi:hypothetical protein FOPE_04888 [Fonsecaea pedrosoi]|nr:hypothetical protein FOPE_04888 [Fonsecaea pedrosoi]
MHLGRSACHQLDVELQEILGSWNSVISLSPSNLPSGKFPVQESDRTGVDEIRADGIAYVLFTESLSEKAMSSSGHGATYSYRAQVER